MPISCPIVIPRLSKDEFGSIDYTVMRHVFATHNKLGNLCDESVYQEHLKHLLISNHLQVESQIPIALTFRSFIKTLYIDLLVAGGAIYELKTVSALGEPHQNQLLNYLFLVNAAHGKLINFRPASVEWKFVNAAMDDAERHRFRIDDSNWRGDSDFRELITELVTDWGTGLDQSLYTQAFVHCLGGEDNVTQQLPMQLDGVPLSNQRFHLVNSDVAFRVTTFTDKLDASHEVHLRRLIAPSPLRALYWVNIARHEITMRVIEA